MAAPIALVTGAGRRIGATIARQLHQAGYRLLLHYRNSANECEALASELNTIRPNSAQTLRADLNRHDAVEQLGQRAIDCWGTVNLLVNNASSFYPTPFAGADETQWDDLIASNLKAPFFLAKALAPALRSVGGAIINIADIHGRRPMANHSIYCIAKAGNIMLTQSLALELAPDVRVNGIAPGAMLWPEDANGQAQEAPQALKHIPLQRLGGADAIADAVAFLARDNNYITGHILTVDGGRSLRQ